MSIYLKIICLIVIQCIETVFLPAKIKQPGTIVSYFSNIISYSVACLKVHTWILYPMA